MPLETPPPPGRLAALLSTVSLIAVALLFLVIIAGPVVRASGSGMGCPDWPKCYGGLIPPTKVSAIPPEFMADFLDPKKGNGNLARTWTEYINRLLGALSGLGALTTLLLSLSLLKKRPLIPVLLLAGFVTFGVVAWLGKVVVDSTLAPHKVTVHFLGGVALTLAFVLAAALLRPTPPTPISKNLRLHVWISLGLAVLQMLLGTQVRETVDSLAPGQCCDGRLQEHLGIWLWGHRLGAILVVISVALLYFRLRAASLSAAPVLIRLAPILLGLEYAVGVLLVRLNLSAFLQPFHAVFGVGLLAVLVALLGRTRSGGCAAVPLPAIS